jgi:hypothetical protein
MDRIAFTTSGSVRSASVAAWPTVVAMSQLGSSSRSAAQATMAVGSTKGMSPWTFKTMSAPPRSPKSSNAASIRSVPDGRSGSVSTARPPAACTTATISASPAATATGPTPAFSAWRSTRTIMGAPPISARGLPGRRVAASRAGIRTMALMPL